MLTVRIIEPVGHERVFEVRCVSAQPANTQTNEDKRIEKVFLERDAGLLEVVDQGTIYVMNGNGKTVATYHLSDSFLSPVAD